jgi:single-strand DNA-binding protein
MASFNKVILLGRIVRDIELKESSSGSKFCSFSLAVNRRSKSGAEEQADFIDCTAFSYTAEFAAKWCKKGTAVIVCGELQQNNYEKDGVKHYSYRVVVNEMQFAESKSGGNVANNEEAEKLIVEEVANDDQLPF